MAEPYHARIRADLLARIESGEWQPGEKLPSTRELVEFYRAKFRSQTLAASTVRHAVSMMIVREELRGQQGIGVFVPDEEPDQQSE
ncbi:MAG TPA: GntR family transcriptional regulator [Micromonosporaceae bacterium]